ncbi:MAG: group II intron reverse transcriptase domain-containing protein [Candidatus Andersenbacteria bacterium]|nr:group II intron reverse transcriptase domain-containing protein [Candidatus Andersenbacteria bacterium]
MGTTSQQIIPAFREIIAWKNLLKSWQEFQRGKRHKEDVAMFASDLIHNLSELQRDLESGLYRHGGYHHFEVADPKPRHIHKASVRDRVVHHALYAALYPYFDQRFIHDSYSCRRFKGTHRAIRQFARYGREAGRNNSRETWVLKGDIRKCFASIDHAILLTLLAKHVADNQLLTLLAEVIGSFPVKGNGKGIPLGNLTSQLFVNIYLNEFDQYVKRVLKVERYIRYADDFVVLSPDKGYVQNQLVLLQEFLGKSLRLECHPDKIFIQPLAQSIDFLGWVHFPDHRVLRKVTRRKMMARLGKDGLTDAVVASYKGLLQHGNAHRLKVSLFGEDGSGKLL